MLSDFQNNHIFKKQGVEATPCFYMILSLAIIILRYNAKKIDIFLLFMIYNNWIGCITVRCYDDI